MTLGFQEMVISFRQICDRSYPIPLCRRLGERPAPLPRRRVCSRSCRRKDIQVELQDRGEEQVQPAARKCAKRTWAFPVTGAGAEVVREGKVRGTGRRFTCLSKQTLRKQACGASCLFGGGTSINRWSVQLFSGCLLSTSHIRTSTHTTNTLSHSHFQAHTHGLLSLSSPSIHMVWLLLSPFYVCTHWMNGENYQSGLYFWEHFPDVLASPPE